MVCLCQSARCFCRCGIPGFSLRAPGLGQRGPALFAELGFFVRKDTSQAGLPEIPAEHGQDSHQNPEEKPVAKYLRLGKPPMDFARRLFPDEPPHQVSETSSANRCGLTFSRDCGVCSDIRDACNKSTGSLPTPTASYTRPSRRSWPAFLCVLRHSAGCLAVFSCHFL